MSLVLCSNGLNFLKLECLKYPYFLYPSVITSIFLFFAFVLMVFSYIGYVHFNEKQIFDYIIVLSILYTISTLLIISFQIPHFDFINNVHFFIRNVFLL